ncbi:amidohydrolase family protein [Youxingia wuxianensis]|uniref:Amidohydrolase n=1 Tax=Youxingia wuxianensis TaxID=2763678 RepID=A0A926EQD5_9FIRM|nr:amidohydrolase family protein [Youxingia wuxianensis]MBC8584614.1 amidohydrolase [Youxingia wuxianensis]
MLIDFHTHAFPDKLAGKTLPMLSKTSGGAPYYTDGTENGTRTKLDAWGVDLAVVLHIATRDGQQQTINNWAKSIQHGKLLCFGTIFPDGADAIDELYRVKELGFYGVKLHPDYQKFFVKEEKYFPIYETLAKLELPLTFHTGWDPVSPDVVHAPPKDVALVAKAFPNLTIIAAHMGGLNRYDESEKYLAGIPNVYLDTAMSSVYCNPEQFERLIRKHGIDRVLFATDCPWSTPEAELALLNRTGLTKEEKEKIMYKNACRLLKLKV